MRTNGKRSYCQNEECIDNEGIGKVKVNFRLRDAIFSRQRYWEEPFPVYYKGMPYMLDESQIASNFLKLISFFRLRPENRHLVGLKLDYR